MLTKRVLHIAFICLLTLRVGHSQPSITERLMLGIDEPVASHDTLHYLAYYAPDKKRETVNFWKRSPTKQTRCLRWLPIGALHAAFGQMPITFDSVATGSTRHNGDLGVGIYYQALEAILEALGIVSSHP